MTSHQFIQATVILMVIAPFIKADSLWFMRNLTCVQLYSPSFGRQDCLRWNETTKMYYYMDFFHLCFPKGTMVQSQYGPIALEQLEVGDKILTWNEKTRKNEFTPVIGWISRDADALSIFKQIETEKGSMYVMSPLHNIAVQPRQKDHQYSKHQYLFANSLIEGDELIYHDRNVSLFVKSVKNSQQLKGLYSPLTSNSNFYIYPHGTTDNFNTNMMALVHCYSQIRNPTKYQKYLTPLLYLSSFFFDEQLQNYVNPLYTKLRFILGDDWKDQSHTTRYDVHHLMGWQDSSNLRQASSPKQKRVSKGSSRSSTRSSHSYHSTSSSNRRRTRKKTAVKLFSILSIMKNTIFNV